MQEADDVDPRYDPRFQRGYKPSRHAAPRQERDADGHDRGRVTPPPAPVQPGLAASQPGQAAPQPGQAAAQPRSAPNAPQANMAGAGPEYPGAESQPDEGWEPFVPGPVDRASASSGVAFWRNPFLIALVVIGIALIVIGVNRYAWATGQLSVFVSPSSNVNYVNPDLITPQVLWAVAPLLTVAGVLALVGVVFFAALRWIPGRRRPPDQSR